MDSRTRERLWEIRKPRVRFLELDQFSRPTFAILLIVLLVVNGVTSVEQLSVAEFSGE